MVDIRPATPSDEQALTELDRSTWSSLSSPAPAPGEGWRFFDEKTKPEDVLVATVGGEVAGYVRLGRATPLAASDHVAMVTGIAVDPARRRQGVGRALIDAALAEAGRRGARRLTLRVLGPNEAARRLYEAAGFAVEGVLREEFFLAGAYVDDVFMARELGGR
ncbi:MAG TPA: GNAT family N-acetyltransferase [Gaiellaceae bacterium]|nr:GNAT family N-acetyltransferase [Gaiellaceae bacterium]